jgi:hypothetical protein
MATNPNPAHRRNIRPGLSVPAGLDPELEKFLSGVKEHLQGADGTRGQPQERFVTLRDLKDIGLVNIGVKNGRGVITGINSDVTSLTAAASSSLATLNDVDTSAAQDGDALQYNAGAGEWVPFDPVELAQDAVGSILVDSAEIDFTYDDLTASITAAIIDASIAYARIADASALSVLGRSADSSGVLADIQAGTDDQVLRRSGSAIGFGALNLASSDAVTGDLAFANIAQLAGFSVAGRSVTGTGDIAAITAGTDDRLLRQTAGALNFGQLTAGMFPNTVVPDAALSSNVPLLNVANVFTAAQRVSLNGAGLTLRGTSVTNSNIAYLAIELSDGTLYGYFGDGSGSTNAIDLYGANGFRFATDAGDLASIEFNGVTADLFARTNVQNTFTDPQIFPAGTTAAPSIQLPHGTAPSSPVDGDIWTTTVGLFVQINGTTVGPLT